jgi:hypothetical protein
MKAYKYLFITILTISVWLFVLGYYVKLRLRVTFRY